MYTCIKLKQDGPNRALNKPPKEKFKSLTFPSLAVPRFEIRKITSKTKQRERYAKQEMEGKEEALKSNVLIRCAKAAFLLSALKFPNSTNDHQDEVRNSLSLSLYIYIFENVVKFNWRTVTGKGEAEERNERDGDGISEGACEEQEDQAMRPNGIGYSGRVASISFHFLVDARSQSDRSVIAICTVP